jgi:hypothetical protein
MITDRTKGTEQTSPLGVISALHALSVICDRPIDWHESFYRWDWIELFQCYIVSTLHLQGNVRIRNETLAIIGNLLRKADLVVGGDSLRELGKYSLFLEGCLWRAAK